MQIDNTSIIGLLRQPDKQEQGFRLLMRQYGEITYWHIRRIVVGHDDAEDVLQETAISIYKNISQFEGAEHQLKSWIYRIATNKALEHLRGKTRFFQSIDDLSPALLQTMITENPIDMDKAEFLIQKRLLSLPTQQRLVFYMRYYDDMTYEEISKVTGRAVGTLKTNFHFARLKIEEELKKLSL